MGVKAYQLGVTGIVPNTTGLGKNLSQQIPNFILIETNDTLATVTTTGYLTESQHAFHIPYNNQQVALVYTTDEGSVWLQVVVTGVSPALVYSLVGQNEAANVFIAGVGSAAAPSFTFSGRTNTGMYSSAANTLDFATDGTRQVSVGGAIVAVNYLLLQGSASTSPVLISAAGTATDLSINLVPKGTGGVNVPTGAIIATTGNIVAGSSGHAGTLTSFPGTATNGKLIIAAVNNAGNHVTTISSVTGLAQDEVMTIPDVGAATGNFLVGGTFVSGNIPQASGTGGLMVDSGVSFASLAPVTASVTMNTASVVGAYATPVQLVAGQAGKAIMVLAAQVVTEVSTPFATGGVAVVQYGNSAHGAGTLAIDATTPAAEITAAASQIYTQYGLATTTVTATAGVTGLGIFFSNQTGPYTNGAASTVTVVLQYMVIPAT